LNRHRGLAIGLIVAVLVAALSIYL